MSERSCFRTPFGSQCVLNEFISFLKCIYWLKEYNMRMVSTTTKGKLKIHSLSSWNKSLMWIKIKLEVVWILKDYLKDKNVSRKSLIPTCEKSDSSNSANFWKNFIPHSWVEVTQPAFTCSKLTIETIEQGVKYVQN